MAPSWRSQWDTWEGVIAGNLITALNLFVLPRKLGAVSGADSTMRMISGRVRMPDVGFTSLSRLPRTLEPIPTLSPDLAVEVLSESNTKEEIDQKLQEYFQSGTRLAWIIDPPTRSAAVYLQAGEPACVLKESATLDGEPVLPGFTLLIADLFKNVPQ